MRNLVSLVLIATLSGCGVFGKVQDVIGSGVKDYCRTPYTDREIIRLQVNAAARPNSVQVNCFGDPVASHDGMPVLTPAQ